MLTVTGACAGCVLWVCRHGYTVSEQDLYLGHVVVVQREIGELLVHTELHFVVVVAVLCHGCDSYSV